MIDTGSIERRRREDRRHDPDAWSTQHRKQVKFIYGLVVGGILILTSLVGGLWALFNDRLTVAVSVTVAAGALLGLVASMPSIFMPVLSAVLKKIPFGRNGKEGMIKEVYDDPAMPKFRDLDPPTDDKK